MGKGNKPNKKSSQKGKDHRYRVHKELRADVVQCDSSIWNSVHLMGLQQDTYTIFMDYDAVVTTDSSGNISPTYGNNPSSTSNWASIAATFDEYRVLAMQVSYKPFEFNGGNVVQAPVTTVFDYDTSAALTGYTLAAQYSSCKEVAGRAGFSRTIYMSGVENGAFNSTGSPVNTFWVKVWSSGNTINTPMYRSFLRFIVQFRGKGI